MKGKCDICGKMAKLEGFAKGLVSCGNPSCMSVWYEMSNREVKIITNQWSMEAERLRK